MSDLHKHMIDLSVAQIKKLQSAFKKRKSVIIGLKNDQLQGGKNGILLTNEQHKLVKKALQNLKGLRLNIAYDQLLKSKEGGLLNEGLTFIEDNIPGIKYVTPFLRKTIIRLLRKEIDEEFKKLEGSGLDDKTLNITKKRLHKAI